MTIWNITQWNITITILIFTINKTIYSKDHKYIVEQLKKARQEIGLDQSEVAKMLDRTQSHVSKVEAGQRRIDVVSLKEFARIYKKPLDYFIK